MIHGVQAILGRIAEIEGRLAQLDAPQPAQAETRSFATVLQAAGPTGTPLPATDEPSPEYDSLVQQSAGRYGLDPGLVHAVIRAESDYDPKCHSHAGAMGLMQLMPETCRGYGISDPYDPAQNIDGGCRELSGYVQQFKGNVELALAAYNAGPNAVRRYGGVPPYRETQAYVPRVLQYWRGGR